MENPKKKKPINPLSQYKAAGDELSYKQFRLATWYVRNRIRLRYVLIGFLTVWSVLTLGYSTLMWGEYLIFGLFEDRDLAAQQVREIENYRAIQPFYTARPLTIERPRVFTANVERYDIFAEVTNQNERWIANVTYKYVFNGGESEIRRTQILPGKLHVLAAHGVESKIFPSSVRLVIENIDWRRVDPHAIRDVQTFIDTRLDIAVENVQFIGRNAVGSPSDQLHFTITNQSAYGYWQPFFSVVLFNRGSIVGIRQVTVDRLDAGASATFDLRFLGPSISITDVEILPHIPIFNPDTYTDPVS